MKNNNKFEHIFKQMRENTRNERNNGPSVSNIQSSEDQGLLTEMNEIGEILP